MRHLALAVLLVAPAGAVQVETSGAHPALYARSSGDPARLSDEHLAKNLDGTAENARLLSRFFAGVGGSKPTGADGRWAMEQLGKESSALQGLITAADSALRKDVQPKDTPTPKDYTISFAPESLDISDEEGLALALAAARSNLASGLAYLLRARSSKATTGADLTKTERGLSRFRDAAAQAAAALAAPRGKSAH